MLPTLSFDPPMHGDWVYEVKYDGFRAIIEWTESNVHIWSRNGKDLLPQFPELQQFLRENTKAASKFLPLILDGEIIIMENNYKGNFQEIQKRGRLKNKIKINEAAEKRPCTFILFDILRSNKERYKQLPFMKRKQKLASICEKLNWPLKPSMSDTCLLQAIQSYHNYSELEQYVLLHNSEGIVAKTKNSTWEEGKRTHTWMKLKNWRTVSCFLTAYDESNGYFYVGVFDGDEIFTLGNFVNGLDSEVKHALKRTIIQNAYQKAANIYYIHPSICLELHYLEWNGEQLREPYFKGLQLEVKPTECTYEHFLISDAKFPPSVSITHPDKVLWKVLGNTKLDFLRYLRNCSSYILPFLQNRFLTVIRAPHGEFGESFYQKSKPESAPEFVQSAIHDDNEMIICNDLETLIWLGNQLAIEFHIPFQTIDSPFVSEIVLDLDPPSRDEFHLAKHAAKIVKKVLDSFHLTGFVKLSGNKGMQVYIPLPDNTFTWKETRVFTEFIANFLVTYDPDSFTIERLKKNRGGKLYVDFIQHAEGKTIIAPYSVRNHSKGLVAAPIFWDEINEELSPTSFTIQSVQKRLQTLGDPFSHFFVTKKEQPFQQVLDMINSGQLM